MTNPYAAPQTQPAPPPPSTEEFPIPSFANALFRWTLICSVSAATSFFLGLEGRSDPTLIAAMVAGILVFAFAYAFLDRTLYWRKLMADPVTRKSIYWAYGIRMAASIIFPVGTINDMFTFMLVGGMFLWPMQWIGPLEPPYSTFAMTIAQGLALNLQMAVGVALFALIGRSRTVPTIAATTASEKSLEHPIAGE